MKKYESPNIELVTASESDLITTSPGTESSIIENEFGIWDLDLG